MSHVGDHPHEVARSEREHDACAHNTGRVVSTCAMLREVRNTDTCCGPFGVKSAAHAMRTTTITSQNTTGKTEAMVVSRERGACELVAGVDARAGHPRWTHKFNFGGKKGVIRAQATFLHVKSILLYTKYMLKWSFIGQV